jgi:hypothetical protein
MQRRMISAKAMVFASISIIGLSMFVFSVINLDANAAHNRLERVLQGVGSGLFLVPTSTVAYSQLRPIRTTRLPT